MRIEISTHNEILENPIVEIDKTIDVPKDQVFIPVIVLIDKDNPTRRFGQYLPPQPYVKGTWTDTDVEAAIAKYIDEIKID